MPSPVKTRADSLREYLTGASSDGGTQNDATLSLGHFRSSKEAVSLGILLDNTTAIANAYVTFASGANGPGVGVLTAIDQNTLTWQPPGAAGPGNQAPFLNNGDSKLVEGVLPGQYLRVTAVDLFPIGSTNVTLFYLMDNVFALGDDVSIANAAAGINEYRATIVRNENPNNLISGLQRYIAQLGTQQVSNVSTLGASGSGTIVTTGSFTDWPKTGYCQVQTSGGSLREVVYYSSRTNTTLTVPAAGRALLGSSSSAGALSDKVFSVPGIAIATDPTGAQSFGSSIQTVANGTTAPAGVTWNTGLTAVSGLQVGNLLMNQQVGFWVWRQIPAGAVYTPFALNLCNSIFNA